MSDTAPACEGDPRHLETGLSPCNGRRGAGGGTGGPVGEPTPAGAVAVDCEEIADHVERARAEAERERREALDPSAAPTYAIQTLRTTVVPQECADELEDRGLTTTR
ncbi:hypothetical protein AB0D65_00565 [Streptomyces griseoloalbus]|uniref:Uncharacterized protein n=1 Tax=Streptomyces griseoloalbus TaxID=67303 RepID=A0ABV3DXA9_9ACTN